MRGIVGIFVASTAAAQPIYVEAGASGGDDHGANIGALTLEAGYQLRDHMWIHGELASGKAQESEPSLSRNLYYAIRAGAEARACAADGKVCAIAGLDGSVRHLENSTMYYSIDSNDFLVMPRGAIDVGSTALRFRFTVETIVNVAQFFRHQFVGTDADIGVVYQW